MSSESVEEVLEEFEEYVEKTGDEVFDRFSTEDADAGYIAGLGCNRGGNTYLVSTAEELNSVNIEFQYRVVNDFATMEEGEEADEADEDNTVISVGSDEPPEEVQERKKEMEEFLQNIDDETKERFYIDVLSKLQNESMAWEIQKENVHDIVGFSLFYRLFPYDDKVSLKDFDTAVQALLSTGIPVRAYIQYTYSLQSDTADSEPDAESASNIPRSDL